MLVHGNGFWDRLLAFLDPCVAQGMIFAENRTLVRVASDPEYALRIVEQTWQEHAKITAHDARFNAVVR